MGGDIDKCTPKHVERFMRRCLALLFILLALHPFAQAAEDTTNDTLTSVKAALAEVDEELKLTTLSDNDLSQLIARIEPLMGSLQTVLADLTPRFEASRKRLVELKPKNGDTHVQPGLAAGELRDEQTRFDKIDADIRSTRAFLLRVEDDLTRISARRREIFTHEIFSRAASVVSPLLWLSVVREIPGDTQSFEHLIADATMSLYARVSFTQLLGFFGICALLLLLSAPLRWIADRVIDTLAQEKDPSRLHKVVVGIWTLTVLSAAPLISLGLIAYAMDVFDISDPRLQGVVEALLDGLKRIAIAYACARAILSARAPVWRLVPIRREATLYLSRLVIGVTVIWSVARLVEAIAETVLSFNLLVLTRGLSSLLIVGLTANVFRKLTRATDAKATRDVGRPLRTFVWLYLVAIALCALGGFIALATYLVEHALQFAALASVLYLLDALVQEACEWFLQADTPAAQEMMTTLGLRRGSLEQIVVLLQGFARLASIAAALVVAIGPFGMPSQDVLATLRSAYFDFSFGGVTLSLSSLVSAFIAFSLVITATRAAQNWLGERYLPRTELDAGVKNSIRTIFGYIGVIVALTLAGGRLGIEADRVAYVAGGLSVGIGFGLQSIANNFVAGLILLWERGIRVGDWIVVGQDQGFVRRINARSTEIETFERATLIVPNLSLTTNTVKNWMHTDRVTRISLTVYTDLESDPDLVRSLLLETAQSHASVLANPVPLAFLSEIAEFAMKFTLIAFVEDGLRGESVRSDLNCDIIKRLRQSGISMPKSLWRMETRA